MIKKYKKKPVIIEAVQWTGNNYEEIRDFTLGTCKLQLDGLIVKGFKTISKENISKANLIIPTLEGDHIASLGDFIIKGINGEFYPCKPDIFENTYDEVLFWAK